VRWASFLETPLEPGSGEQYNAIDGGMDSASLSEMKRSDKAVI
jgi:hypothetical protein